MNKNIVGLITEYNPFHNGHLYHLKEACQKTRAEYVVVVMSGHFLQRGEPAIVNKWTRAKMAVSTGADIVFEIPAAFSVAGAPSFAMGAVSLLNATGIISHLCFGSESGDINELQQISGILHNEPTSLQQLIKAQMSKGKSYPAALHEAILKWKDLPPGLKDVLATPNNVLGIEYLKALKDLHSKIKPITIKRFSAGYHDKELAENVLGIASASAIRREIASTALNFDLQNYLPESSFTLLHKEFSAGRGPVLAEKLTCLIKYKLLTTSTARVVEIFDVTEGLEGRLQKIASMPGSYTELLTKLKTRRYSWTKLQRVLIQLLLGYTKEKALSFHRDKPGYLRLLAFSPRGEKLLSEIKKRSSLPIVSNVRPFLTMLEKIEGVTPSARDMLLMDILATDIYTLLYPDPGQQKAGLDYLNGPVTLKSSYN